MKKLFILCILINLVVNTNSYSKCQDLPVKVAVVDTGFGFQGKGKDAKLCLSGHKDFTESGFTVNELIPPDTIGHGTNVTGIIESYAQKAHINYCIVVIKYYRSSGEGNLRNTILSFKHALSIGAKYINYSSIGGWPVEEERLIVKKFLNSGGTLIVAAGNDGENIDFIRSGMYPAMYDKRIIVVGMLEKNGKRSNESNYGKIVNRWEIGRNVIGYGIIMNGTSMSTAVATGKILSKNKNRCDIGE